MSRDTLAELDATESDEFSLGLPMFGEDDESYAPMPPNATSSSLDLAAVPTFSSISNTNTTPTKQAVKDTMAKFVARVSRDKSVWGNSICALTKANTEFCTADDIEPLVDKAKFH